MKGACVFVLLFVAAFTSANYLNKHNNFDVDSLLLNNEALEHYIQCFLDKAECNPLAADVKATILEAFEDGCAQCSPQQISNLQRAFAFMYLYKKQHANNIFLKLDPKRRAGHIYNLETLQAIKNLPSPRN